MKKLIKIAILLLLTTNGYAQINLVTKKIPLVSENIQVDSLASDAIKKINSKSLYYSIEIKSSKGRFSFTIDKLDTRKSTATIRFENVLKKHNLRYFKFKNNFIFVMGDDVPFNFFQATRHHRSFKFDISESASSYIPRPDDYTSKIYSYFNGKFIFEPVEVAY